MGALSSLLAGFGQGFGEHNSEIIERKRQEQVQNTRLANEALLNDLRTNTNRSPDEQENILRQVLKNYGVKDQHIGMAVDHLKQQGILGNQSQGQRMDKSPVAGPMPQMGGGQGQAQTPQPQAQGGIPPMPSAPKFSYGMPIVEGIAPYNPAVDIYDQQGNFDPEKIHKTPQALTSQEYASRASYMQRANQTMEEQAKQGAEGKKSIMVEDARQKRNLDIIQKLSSLNQTKGGPKYTWLTTQSGNIDVKPDMGKWRPAEDFEIGADHIGELDGNNKPIDDPNAVYRVKDFAQADSELYPVGGARKTDKPIKNANGEWVYPLVNRAGIQIGERKGAPTPFAETPRDISKTVYKQVQVQGPNGPETQLVPVTESEQIRPGSTGTPGAATPATPIPSRPTPGQPAPRTMSFPRPLTPEQTQKSEGMYAQLGLALQRANGVRNNLNLVDSLIDAKKISIEADPSTGLIHAAIARNVPLTDKEAQFAADMRSLMEDINLLREPLGAQGFRGHEAFATLQAQAGNLIGHPEVTKRVLDNTINAMNAQRHVVGVSLGHEKNTPNTPLPNPPGGGPKKLTSRADYKALKSGDHYIDADGKEKIKR